MKRHEQEKELRELKELYAKVERMSEAKAQEFMNTDDDKNTILMYIQEDMDEIEEKLEELDCEEEEANEPWWRAGLDPAFRSWSEYYGMFL